MIPITERVGRSPFYERPAHATKREAEKGKNLPFLYKREVHGDV